MPDAIALRAYAAEKARLDRHVLANLTAVQRHLAEIDEWHGDPDRTVAPNLINLGSDIAALTAAVAALAALREVRYLTEETR